MKILKNKELQSHVTRYLLISILGYLYIFLTLYVLVTIIKIDKSIAFMSTYAIWYFLLYFIQLKLLFKTPHKKNKLVKFCVFLVIFYLIANLLYNIGIYLKLDYIISTVVTILILMPLRFIVSKYYVYI